MTFAHLQPLTNVPAKYQLPTPYGCRDIARTRFSNSRSLRQGQKSNQGQTMTLHTYTPQPMSLPSMNFLHLTVSEIQPGQSISRQPPDRPPIRTPWVKTMGCFVISIMISTAPMKPKIAIQWREMKKSIHLFISSE